MCSSPFSGSWCFLPFLLIVRRLWDIEVISFDRIEPCEFSTSHLLFHAHS